MTQPDFPVASGLVDHILETPGRRVVLIDGGAGSGKTVLSNYLASQIPSQLVHLDDIYPGWEGLEYASELVPLLITGSQPSYPKWDWAKSQVSHHVPVSKEENLIIEGCGALTRNSAPLATFRIWCELAEPIRKKRALTRDNGNFDAHWDSWADQEQLHWRRNRPWELADQIWRPSLSIPVA